MFNVFLSSYVLCWPFTIFILPILDDESISLKFQPPQSLAKNQFIYVERIYILSTFKRACVCSLPWRQKNVNIDISNTY